MRTLKKLSAGTTTIKLQYSSVHDAYYAVVVTPSENPLSRGDEKFYQYQSKPDARRKFDSLVSEITA